MKGAPLRDAPIAHYGLDRERSRHDLVEPQLPSRRDFIFLRVRILPTASGTCRSMVRESAEK